MWNPHHFTILFLSLRFTKCFLKAGDSPRSVSVFELHARSVSAWPHLATRLAWETRQCVKVGFHATFRVSCCPRSLSLLTASTKHIKAYHGVKQLIRANHRPQQYPNSKWAHSIIKRVRTMCKRWLLLRWLSLLAIEIATEIQMIVLSIHCFLWFANLQWNQN